MTTGHDQFHTAVLNSSGQWPGLPRTWSYSSLREAEECPRRWMLSRAAYPEIWSRPGYPVRPALPALLGEVVHRVLEIILRGLQARGCASLADGSAVAALKSLGGYSRLAERAIQERMQWLADNPRTSERIGALRTALLARVPEIRQRTQEIISRTTLQPVAAPAGAASSAERAPLAEGSHPEVELRVHGLRLAGRADLVTITSEGCEITDYKTGAPDRHHADQLRTYALLWSRDTELNPASLPVRHLILAYPSSDTYVDPPGPGELAELESQVAARIGGAERSLQERPPPARPAAPMCRLCGVRQLCDDYWACLNEFLEAESAVGGPDWFDHEGTVIRRNGPRSWLLTSDTDGRPNLLLRTSSETTGFRANDRVRLLNLLRDRDTDSPVPIGTVTQASEIFLLGSSG